ncbi:hypothetical protein PC116_g23191 [Phytophthora cactorum]|nr:hypothetical protein PC116_g23191 [Phytophthora cactorum]
MIHNLTETPNTAPTLLRRCTKHFEQRLSTQVSQQHGDIQLQQEEVV